MNDHRIAMDDDFAAKIPKEKRCDRCEGTGNKFLFMYAKCPDCDGTGIKSTKATVVDLSNGIVMTRSEFYSFYDAYRASEIVDYQIGPLNIKYQADGNIEVTLRVAEHVQPLLREILIK
jgi:hypothetical protein